MPVVRSLGVLSSFAAIAATAPSGRSWLILAVINRVITIVATKAQAVEKNPKPQPAHRSTVSTSRKTGIPTSHAT
ncbi:hypothetical protein BB31_19785 [Amycolatopsis lurida NRRL 2430]|uniref:Secreted protein n=1 Tax=Amycolatopsis lurida NRRL 2430 TaxID=1460371 RepID=A0A2P2FRY0_AMYLU|nr:hypothetical protein BB31_19785 [Amycolatopsis lurida NRRL 2430]